jgi:AraC-like DNA-binding protein
MFLDIDYHPCQGAVTYKNGYQTLMASQPLSHWVHGFWQLNVPTGEFCYRSIPDNCVDLVVNQNDPQEIFIVPPFASPLVFELAGPVSYFGIRFRILGHLGFIPVPLGEWNASDQDARTAEVVPSPVLNAVHESFARPMNFNARCQYLTARLLATVQDPDIDPRLARYIRYCHKNTSSNISISDRQCSEFGLSARQLRRLSQLYLGLSPRGFARVQRFQHALHLMKTVRYESAWLDCYYDQPHFIREFKQLSGVTPTEFKTLSVLYNSEQGN